jgi:hypothetical protein
VCRFIYCRVYLVHFEMSKTSYIHGRMEYIIQFNWRSIWFLEFVFLGSRIWHLLWEEQILLTAPKRVYASGRANASREGAIRKLLKWSRFCYIFKEPGHKRTACPHWDLRKKREAAQCLNCGLTGHWKTTCGTPMNLDFVKLWMLFVNCNP